MPFGLSERFRETCYSSLVCTNTVESAWNVNVRVHLRGTHPASSIPENDESYPLKFVALGMRRVQQRWLLVRKNIWKSMLRRLEAVHGKSLILTTAATPLPPTTRFQLRRPDGVTAEKKVGRVRQRKDPEGSSNIGGDCAQGTVIMDRIETDAAAAAAAACAGGGIQGPHGGLWRGGGVGGRGIDKAGIPKLKWSVTLKGECVRLQQTAEWPHVRLETTRGGSKSWRESPGRQGGKGRWRAGASSDSMGARSAGVDCRQRGRSSRYNTRLTESLAESERVHHGVAAERSASTAVRTLS